MTESTGMTSPGLEASASACWLRFVSVEHLEGDTFTATFEVDGIAQPHVVTITEHDAICGVSGTTFFAMMDRGGAASRRSA
jgi:hypothetical protein